MPKKNVGIASSPTAMLSGPGAPRRCGRWRTRYPMVPPIEHPRRQTGQAELEAGGEPAEGDFHRVGAVADRVGEAAGEQPLEELGVLHRHRLVKAHERREAGGLLRRCVRRDQQQRGVARGVQREEDERDGAPDGEQPGQDAAAEVPAADRQANGAQPGDEPGGVGCTQACGGMGEGHGKVLRWDDGVTPVGAVGGRIGPAASAGCAGTGRRPAGRRSQRGRRDSTRPAPGRCGRGVPEQ